MRKKLFSRISSLLSSRFLGIGFGFFIALNHLAMGQTLYLDTNGATAGFANGATSWNGSVWSTDVTGSSAATTWTDNNTAYINMQAASFTLTANQNVNLSGLTVTPSSGNPTLTLTNAAARTITLSGGTIDLTTALITLSNNVTLTGNFTMTGAVSNSNTSSVLNFLTATGASAYAGTATINSGRLTITDANRVGTSSNIALEGGTVLTQVTSTIGNLSGSSTASTISNNNATSTSLTITQSSSGSYSGVLGSNAHVTGTLGYVKDGAATLTLAGTGANTYDGSFTINAGTVILQKTAGVNAIAAGTGLIVGDNSGTDTLQWGASNQVADTTAVTLNGGTLNLAGSFSETMGTLTMSNSSIINFGTVGTGQSLVFADSSAMGWSGTLSIYNWQAGVDTLRFGTTSAGLTVGQLGMVSFYSNAGTTFLGAGSIDANGFMAAVPEPSTSMLILLSGILLVFSIYRKRRAEIFVVG